MTKKKNEDKKEMKKPIKEVIKNKKETNKLKKNQKEQQKVIEKRAVNFSLIEMIMIVIIVSLVVGLVSGYLVFKNYSFIKEQTNAQAENKELEEFTETYEEVVQKYYKDIDKSKLIDSAIDGMLNYLDVHTSYLDEDETNELQTRLEGEYKGIGVEISMTTDSKIIIMNVFADTPAFKSGLQQGDIIISVDGKSTENMTSSDVANEIKGSNKEKVTIEYERNGEKQTAEVNLSIVTIPSVTYEVFEDNIGYADITEFSATTYSQMKSALEEFDKKEIKSLIIDVRNNTGGYLSSAKSIAELFLDKGQIIYQLKYKDGTTKKYEATRSDKKDYKVVVLINGASASASEILAAALKESYGAKLIGTKSFGKGTIQETDTLSTGAMIKYTSAYWLTPKGNSINEVGLEPDILVENVNIEEDKQLNEAIKALK